MPPLCCGCSCTIYTNDFSAALSGFTTTGSPSTSGGLLVMTAGDRVIATTEPSSASDSIHLTTGALTTDATATLRLICAWVDSSNYLFGEVSRAAGAITLRLGQVAGGVSTWLTDAVTVQDTGAELDERHVISLCWTPGPVLEEEAAAQTLLPWRATDNGGDWSDETEVLELEGAAATTSFGVGEDETDIIEAYFQFGFAPGFIPEEVEVGWLANKSDVDPVGVTDSFAQLIDDSGFIGANEATEAYSIADDPAETAGGYDPLDTWGATLTDTIVNSTEFGVGLRFKRDDTGAGTTVNLYHVTMSVRGTIPERRHGRLRLSYQNSSDSSLDCATDYAVVLTGDGLDGKAAGLAVTAGDWDFDAFTLSYGQSASRPTCPACTCTVEVGQCDCCDPAEPPAVEYLLDFSGVALVDDECNGCDQVDGFYVVEQISPCFWFFRDSLGTCTHDATAPGGLSVTLTLHDNPGFPMESCRWRAMIGYQSIEQNGPEAAWAMYESDEIASCDDMPVTLNKVTDYVVDSCTGTFPASITLDLP
jgi:hypothetical protein